jgi:RNA polymerase sigma-70 factor, ECF subfamily
LTSEEKQLIASLQQGERTAMESVFKQYHAVLCTAAYYVVKDTDEAKDIVQDVFIKLWKNRQQLEIQSSLAAYLKRAVVNTALNYLEKQKKFKAVEIGKSGASDMGVNAVEHNHNSAELSAKAEKTIESLPPRTRAVYTLIRAEEMSYKEAAEALSISVKAVEKEMMKALRLLRIALKEFLIISLLLLAHCFKIIS